MKSKKRSRNVTTQMLVVFLSLAVLLTARTGSAQQIAPPQLSEPGQVQKVQVQSLKNAIRLMASEKEKLAAQIDSLSSRLQVTRDEQNQLFEKQFALGVSVDSYGELTRSLQSQKVQLVIDLAGLDARRKALQLASKEMRKSEDEQIIAPLIEMVKLAKRTLDEQTQAQQHGSAGAADVREAERKLLMSQIQLAEAQRSQSKTSNISNDLFETSLSRAEKQARLTVVEKMLSSLAQARDVVDRTKQLGMRAEGINQSILKVSNRYEQVEFDLSQTKTELEQIERAE